MLEIKIWMMVLSQQQQQALPTHENYTGRIQTNISFYK